MDGMSPTKGHFSKVRKHNLLDTEKQINCKSTKRGARETWVKTKEHDKTPERELSGDRQSTRKRVQVIIVKMIKDLRRRMEKQSEKLKLFNRDEKYIN